MAILDSLQLTSQVEKLAQVSRELRRKQKQMQNQVSKTSVRHGVIDSLECAL